MTDSITIYDAHGAEKATVTVGAGSTRRFELMQEDSITTCFSLAEAVHFGIGCYCDIADEGGRFVVISQQSPTYNTATGGYDYNLRMDAEYWQWGNKLFMYTPEDGGREASWSLTAAADVHLGILMRNLKARGYSYGGKEYTFSIDGSVQASAKAITYSNSSIIDALGAMADAWECEWWVEQGTVHLGRMEYAKEPVDFKVGVNVESMERSDSRQDYATRIYVFGGESNIPSRYRRKLEFTVTAVTQSDGGSAIEDVARGITPEMFADSDVTRQEYASSASSAVHGVSTPADSGYMVSSKFEQVTDGGYVQDRTLPAGDYTIEMTGGGADVEWGVKGIPIDAGRFVMVWEIIARAGEDETTLWTGETEVLPDTAVSVMPEPQALPLHLDEDSGLSIIVYGHFEALTGTLNGYDIQGTISFRGIAFNAKGNRDSARVAVDFITGALASESHEGVLNPEHTAAGEGKIVLPAGVTPSIGDKYVIRNIVAMEVPAGYFTPDTDAEMVVGGVVQKRLMLPIEWNGGRNFIDAESGQTDAETVELVVVNDGIYPRFSSDDGLGGTLDGRPTSDVAHREDIVMDDETDTRVKVTYWAIKDETLDFAEKYIIEGKDLEVTFCSGLLNGMKFKADFIADGTSLYGKGGQWFEIVRSDDYGRQLPDDVLHPEAGDRYVLTGWDTSYMDGSALVEQAEDELLEWGKKYMEKLNTDPSTYTCHMMSDDAYGKGPDGRLDAAYSYKAALLPGDPVRLFSDAFFKEGSRLSRIIGYERSLDIDYDTPIYIVGETVSYSRLGELSDKIDSIVMNGQTYVGQYGGGGGTSVYVLKTGDTTAASDRNVFSALRTLRMFMRKDTADTATAVMTFLEGILFGEDGTSVIDGEGNATLSSLKTAAAEIARAAIEEITGNVKVEGLATFAAGVVTELLRSPDFEEGLAGFGIHKTASGKYRLETDELLVRVKAIFNELEIRKLSYCGGNMEMSGAGGTIVRVKELTRDGESSPYGWRCYMMKDDGTTRTRNWWRVGDMAKCQTMNIEGETVSTSRLLALGTRLITANGALVGYGAGRTGSTGNRYYWRLVTAVGSETLDDGREYDWVELTDEDTVELTDSEGVVVQCEGKDKVFDGMDLDGTKWHADANDAPAAGDEIVQEGSQTDPTRQHLIRLSVVGENAPAIEEYVGVGRHDGLGVYNLSARRMTALAPRTGNIFRARRFEIETEDGTVTRLVRDRGEWEEGMKCLYYDRVSYGGGLWLCVAKLGTTARPAEGSSDWQRQVAPGKDGAPGVDGTDGDPGKDGAENAITAYLTPQSLVVDQKTDGSGGFDLDDARMTLTVIRGVSEEITGSCQITVATGQGCTVEHEGYNVWLTGITGTPKRASVEVLVKIPADILQPAGDTVTCRADIAVNYPGTFKETIENDVKTQLAQKTFSYVDEEGKTVEVAGISTLQQSAEGIRQEVWRRQPAGSVITNGQFTDGLEKWAVAGDVTTVRMMNVPAACLRGTATMEQSADDMTCDWSKVLNDEDSKTPVQARLTMRLWTPSGCKLSVMVESVVGDVLLEWSRQYGGLDGWTDVVVEQVQGKGVVQLWNRPRYLRISVEGTECYVADVQLVPDMTAALGAKLELTAEYFRSTVTGLDGRMTEIEQTADKISLTVQQTLDNLEATGIMLADRRIVATADNFEIRNNKGETTMRVDEDGQLSIRELRVDSQTDNKAGVQVGIDADGNPYLVGINKDGDTVWRFSGNIEINYGDGVNMRILSTSKAKLWTHEYANGDMEYIVQYYICVLLTNLSNEALTYNGDALQCRVDDWRTDGGTDYITVPFSSGGVTVPAMGSAEVLFASGDITYRVTETGGVIPSNPGLEWGGTTGVSVLYNSAAVGWVVKDEADIMFVRGELRPLSLNE